MIVEPPLRGDIVTLRDLRSADVEVIARWLGPGHRWQEFDAPYFPRPTSGERSEYLDDLRHEIDASTASPRRRLVVADPGTDLLLGQVSWYWESQATDWRRMGIVLYDPASWNGGRGTEAIRLWTSYLFATTEARRLDYATWSGNAGMLTIGRKLGFTEEARFREARCWDGRIHDSVVMGVLRAEWTP